MTELILLAVAIPAFFLTMAWEWWWLHRHSKNTEQIGYEVKDTFVSLSMGSGYLLLNGIFKVIQLPIYHWIYERRFFEFEDGILSWVALVVLVDFCYYWNHRINHESRILWAGHVNHHSSQHYNLSTALRQSWSSYTTSFVFYIPILLVGFSPNLLLASLLVHLFYQYWIHTEAIDKLGWLEHILMTPSHHRVHHASNPQYLDRNHGGLLIVWDKLFGTFEPEVEPPIYGISKNIESFNLIVVAFHEYKDIYKDVRGAKSPSEAFQYVVRGPGWRPSESAAPQLSPETPPAK